MKSPWKTPMMIASTVALLVCGVLGWMWPGSFWPGYLAAAVFWTSISLGCLGLALLHALTGGRWGWAMNRECHAGLMVLPLMLLAFVPFLFASGCVFPWAHSQEELNRHQRVYLAPSLVLLRTLVNWALWSLMAAWLIRGFRRVASDPERRVSSRKAAVGIVVFWVSLTTASVDGLMSLDPGWTSSMFGAITVMGCVVAGLSWILLMRSQLPARRDYEQQLSHDLGNLLMAFNLIWVYLSFSQYLIIWSGDLEHEVTWYLVRQTGWAGVTGTSLLLLHFVVPFLLLLSIDLKRRPRQLGRIAGLLLVMRAFDTAWVIFPAIPGADWRMCAGMLASLLLIGCAWVTAWRMAFTRLPAIDVLRFPEFEEMAHGQAVEVGA